MEYLKMMIVALTVVVVSKLIQMCRIVLWRPYAITKSLRDQGIKGPSCSFLFGSLGEMKKWRQVAMESVLDTNSHDITPRVVPHLTKWSSQYGETFLYWYGLQPRLVISDIELAKHVLSSKSDMFVKPKQRPSAVRFGGKGLAMINGLDWSRHRRIINPAFTVDKLKALVMEIATCGISMLEDWKPLPSSSDEWKKIELHGEFKRLMFDVIAHTAFGSNYEAGKLAFQAQTELGRWSAASVADNFIPGSQYLPTHMNRKIWKLDNMLKDTIKSIINSRLNSLRTGNSNEYGNDLLGTMIASSDMIQTGSGPKLNMEEIIEECKTFFIAGHGTTANLLTWTVFLLGINPEWQTKLRQEILQHCGTDQPPDADMLSKLKMLNMVFLESLRLYGPVIRMFREASQDVKMGDISIPKGTSIEISALKMHRSEEYWGKDAREFKPLRFMDGIAKAAKHPKVLLGFGLGPRYCIGQNLATLIIKTMIVLILQRFSFSLSPEYKHTPVDNFLMEPQHGVPVIAKPWV